MAVGRRQQFAVVITRPHTQTVRKKSASWTLTFMCVVAPTLFIFCVYNFFKFKKGITLHLSSKYFEWFTRRSLLSIPLGLLKYEGANLLHTISPRNLRFSQHGSILIVTNIKGAVWSSKMGSIATWSHFICCSGLHPEFYCNWQSIWASSIGVTGGIIKPCQAAWKDWI